MEKPIVAIIGRANVGKSTLFNKIIGKRVAIVKDISGVTRDRNYGDCTRGNKSFVLVDTGGFEPITKEDMMVQVREQTRLAIEEADVIIFLGDGREGITLSDLEISKMLRKSGKKFVFAVNKIDDVKHQGRVNEFYKIGTEEIFAISSEHKVGIDNLMEKVVSIIPEYSNDDSTSALIKISVVGRPNVGKSSLINQILNEKRMLVSEIPGTTRDAIDTLYEMGDKKYLFIDTAGIRKKRKISQKLEKYSVMMSMRSIEKSDIALLLVDASRPITEQDVKVAGMVHDAGRGAIIVINKWDLVEKDTNTVKDYTEVIKDKLKYMPYAPVVTISASSGQRVQKIFPLIDSISHEQSRKIPTPNLNKVVERAVNRRKPSHYKGRPIKLYYVTQVKFKPPTFMIFVNYAEGIHFSYTRYLQNEIRRELGFVGTPINIVFKNRKRKVKRENLTWIKGKRKLNSIDKSDKVKKCK